MSKSDRCPDRVHESERESQRMSNESDFSESGQGEPKVDPGMVWMFVCVFRNARVLLPRNHGLASKEAMLDLINRQEKISAKCQSRTNAQSECARVSESDRECQMSAISAKVDRYLWISF